MKQMKNLKKVKKSKCINSKKVTRRKVYKGGGCWVCMLNKNSYTPKEVESMIENAIRAYENYLNKLGKYEGVQAGAIYGPEGNVKEELNKSVTDCKRKIPKSLIDKLKIKRVKKE